MLTFYFKIVHYYNITYIRSLIMNGKISADFIITNTRKGINGQIESVLIGYDPIYGTKINTENKSKEYVINLIKGGKKVITSRANTEGANVEIFTMNGIEYLRTDPNCSAFDNLNNLPSF